MGCGCGCEHEEETEHTHKHCGKPMKCKEDKYICVKCGFEEECDCGQKKDDAESPDD